MVLANLSALGGSESGVTHGMSNSFGARIWSGRTGDVDTVPFFREYALEFTLPILSTETESCHARSLEVPTVDNYDANSSLKQLVPNHELCGHQENEPKTAVITWAGT